VRALDVGAVTINEMLTTARQGLVRLSAEQAAQAVNAGAVLVDIRPERQRRAEGEVPSVLIVERNVLEWRFDPSSEARLPVADHDLHIVVLCSQGYTSSLAAASLQQLGVHRATDVIGGFHAWRSAGLPTIPGGLFDDSPTVPSTASSTKPATASRAGGEDQP
jgi:rhodanese-related sulfurtransferase